MKKLGFLLLACGLVFGSLQAWELTIKAKEAQVALKADKDLVDGDNKFDLVPTLGGKVLKDASIKLNFIVPEMPGMAAMNKEAQVREKDGIYRAEVNLPMNGPWQIKVQVRTKEGKIYQGEGSVDILMHGVILSSNTIKGFSTNFTQTHPRMQTHH
ncbi:FixH family protein [Helicobacter suis]|uniref:FixH family protein n=1 Tax=Helicobacter suis TaxID=104628 RepID=UPI0013CFB562|nr:FixH family protein [Helicobacter suis]